MKNITICLLVLFLSSCTMYRKDDGDDNIRPVVEDLIKDKGVAGLRVELTKIPAEK